MRLLQKENTQWFVTFEKGNKRKVVSHLKFDRTKARAKHTGDQLIPNPQKCSIPRLRSSEVSRPQLESRIHCMRDFPLGEQWRATLRLHCDSQTQVIFQQRIAFSTASQLMYMRG
ncbi:hypothetical protein AVEN_174946-1 [Araneus ventricosus]|uniref:Uncharacterized protein n=1 Tax=Araneus ventricosus TaxID=182803 RepID=A0A4Y2RL46_ARAVE|nr:hypothetical protein AVEN_129572-1 [Araneus ventricosus]GBN76106.1 hypothetical protein AVEN_174946-1 [Araneus ventricosus]